MQVSSEALVQSGWGSLKGLIGVADPPLLGMKGPVPVVEGVQA